MVWLHLDEWSKEEIKAQNLGDGQLVWRTALEKLWF